MLQARPYPSRDKVVVLAPWARVKDLLNPSSDDARLNEEEREFITQCDIAADRGLVPIRRRLARRTEQGLIGIRYPPQSQAWHYAFDWLQATIRHFRTAGGVILKQRADDDENYLEAVVLGFHAEAISVGQEILSLLSNGFPSAAMAACRKIHELAVTAVALVDAPHVTYEKRTLAARKYLAREPFITSSLAEKLERFRVGERLANSQDLAWYEEIRRRSELARREYGNSVRKHYGWAEDLIPGRSDIKLSMLEEIAGLAHLSVLQELGTTYVHPNGKSWLRHYGKAAGVPEFRGLQLPAYIALKSLRLTLWSSVFSREDRSATLYEYLGGVVGNKMAEQCETQLGRAEKRVDRRENPRGGQWHTGRRRRQLSTHRGTSPFSRRRLP